MLLVVAIGELTVVNAGVNPVLPASQLGAPAWTSALKDRPGERFYFGGKFRGSLLEADIDLRGVQARAPRANTVEEGRAIMDATPFGRIKNISAGESAARLAIDPESNAMRRGWEYWARQAGCGELLAD